jgi:hypothetical protein
MNRRWTTSIAGLPEEGQHIEFVLAGRQVAIPGTFVRRVFRSRWSGYGVARVQRWRVVDPEPSVATQAQSDVIHASPA